MLWILLKFRLESWLFSPLLWEKEAGGNASALELCSSEAINVELMKLEKTNFSQDRKNLQEDWKNYLTSVFSGKYKVIGLFGSSSFPPAVKVTLCFVCLFCFFVWLYLHLCLLLMSRIKFSVTVLVQCKLIYWSSTTFCQLSSFFL